MVHLLSRHDRERAPSEALNLARVVLDNMYQFVALLDLEGNLLDVNRTALDGGGLRRDAILGRPFWEAHWWTVSRETQEQVREAIARAARGEFVRYEVDVLGGAAGSELITIDFSINPVRAPDGSVIYLLPEGRNITEKKLAEAELARKTSELERLNERLREFDRLKTQFFANVSHELRTPLALVLGPVERLLADERTAPDAREVLGVVERNGRTLLKHVNDLLDLSRLEAGRMPMRYAEVCVSSLARFVASHFELLASERGIELRVVVPDDANTAEIDPEKIQRVGLNLLSNAFKFVPDGGTVVVAVDVGRDQVSLRVEDSGPGIPQEMTTLVLERFRQLDGSTTRTRGGTGLGLSIVHEFVQLHLGTVEISRSPLGGARVTVTLPRSAPEGTSIAPASSVDPDLSRQTLAELGASVHRSPPRVASSDVRPLALVVEDHPEMNDFVAHALSERFRVVQAFDGGDARARLAELRPDLLVCDVMMPVMSGVELARAVREDPAFDEVPIVMLTAKADDELRVRMLGSGVDDYVQKPFSPAELLARATRLVSERKRAAELLRRSDARYRRIVETAREGIVSLDAKGCVAFANRAMTTFLGTTVLGMLGEPLLDFVVDDDRPAMQAWLARLDDGAEPLEARFRRQDGAIVFGLARATPDPEAPELGSVFVTVGDVTSLKRALREKEALLREVHHRVKNNLQVVSSLLYLQTTQETSTSPSDALLIARNRVESISLVHDVLHQGENLAALDFGAYVEGLCRRLAEVYVRGGAQRIELRVQIESAPSSVDMAVPCGLVLNELISNAFKHAFPGGRSGEVSVSLHVEDDRFVVAVSDNGVGIGDVSGAPGLGLRLVQRLAQQARATVELTSRTSGTTITLTIPRAGVPVSPAVDE